MSLRKANWPKLVLQWGVVGAIILFVLFGHLLTGTPTDPEAYCPFGGLQALGSYLANNSLACSMSMVQIMMGVTLAVGIVLFSKLFCGYLCPLGTVGEALSRGGSRMKVNYDIAAGSIADKLLRAVKYGLLFVVFYMSVSSSELFCKNFDPYYAIATGFKGEITAWMTVISILLLFLGNVFVRMFWCKYICPLGAVSNIFKFTLLFVVIILLVWVLGIAGVASGWVWALGAACLASYLLEISCMKSKVFPLLRITRDTDTCIDCGVCAKKCPYSIPVDQLKTVKHIDCTMCGQCVSSCPVDAVAVNKRRSLRFLPAIITVVLFAAAIFLGNTWELPTIDEKWGEREQIESRLETFEMDGLTSVKCYGSSKAFSSKMQKVPGVYGVKTYVKRFAVIITYDPTVINEEGIRKAIFTPTKMKFRTPAADAAPLRVMKLGVDGLFDRMDIVYFGNILRHIPGIYGFSAEFSCPVDVTLYTDPGAELSKRMLRDSIEVKTMQMPVHGGGTKDVKIHYSLESYEPDGGEIAALDFVNLMFEETRALSGKFIQSSEKYADDATYPKSVYQIEYPEIEKPLVKRYFPYFKSFLSLQDGLTKIDVTLDGTTPVLRLTYVGSMWDDEKIWRELFNAPVWDIKYKDGSVKPEKPKFTFKKEGHTL